MGTGENLRAKRGHTFAGAGVYRSDDAGETWQSLGLEDTFHVRRKHMPTGRTKGITPMVYCSENEGATWTSIVSNLPAADTLQMEVTDSEQKVIMSSTVTSVRGFNTFSWDLVTERVDKDNPYHFKTHLFPDAGEYGIRWRSSRTDIEASFTIKEQGRGR